MIEHRPRVSVCLEWKPNQRDNGDIVMFRGQESFNSSHFQVVSSPSSLRIKRTWCIQEASPDKSALMGRISEVFRCILHFNVALSSAVIFNSVKYSSALVFDHSFLPPQSRHCFYLISFISRKCWSFQWCCVHSLCNLKRSFIIRLNET